MQPKKILSRIFKITLVCGIFVFLYRSGQFDISKLRLIFDNPFLFTLSAFLIFSGSLFAVDRWRILLLVCDIKLDFITAAKLTFAGFFYSSFIPGAVSGDIIKAYYLAKGKSDKTKLVMTVFLDRIIGLYTLFLGAFAVIPILIINQLVFGSETIRLIYQLKALVSFILLVFATMSVVGYFAIKIDIKNFLVMNNLLYRLPLQHQIGKVLDAVHQYNNTPILLLMAILYSLSGQIFLYAGIWCLGNLLQIDLHLSLYFLILPICLIINAIPVAPGGIGVGEAGFSTIFQLVGSGEGAELALLFHFIVFFFSVCLGGIVYSLFDFSEIEF